MSEMRPTISMRGTRSPRHGLYEGAKKPGRRQAPGQSISCYAARFLATPLARLGRLDEAKASAARLMALDPHFSIGRWSAAVGAGAGDCRVR